MRSARTAEWILARFTNREHAAAIVGDLMEGAPAGGAWAFWWAVVRTAVGLGWRAAAGCLLAPAAVLLAVQPLVRPGHRIGGVGLLFMGIALCFSAVVWYGALRYGIKDRMTQLAAALLLASGCGVSWRWVPTVVALSAALGFIVLAAAMFAPDGRRAAAALLAALVGSIVAWKILWAILPGRFDTPESQMKVQLLCRLAALGWTPVWAAAWTRRFLNRRARRGWALH